MRNGQDPLLPTVSHGLHPHPKGLGARAVGVRAVNPPPQHMAGPKAMTTPFQPRP